MKKILPVILALLCSLALCSCGETDPDTAFDNLRDYVKNYFENDNYYMQLAKTKADEQTMTEVSVYGGDKAFLSYDLTGALTFYRNGKLQTVNAGSYYTPEEKDSKWEDHTYQKTADKYRDALEELCTFDYKNKKKLAFTSIEKVKSDNGRFPYKVTVDFNIDQMNVKGLFNSGADFKSLRIKFLTNDDGTVFDDITITAQYTYDSEITVIAVKFGDPKKPDENSGVGQRPEDIEEVYKEYLEQMQKSYQEYLTNLQKNMIAADNAEK